MRTWKLAVLVGAVTAASVTGVALALDRPGDADGWRATGTMMVAQKGSTTTGDDSRDDTRTSLWQLMQDDGFRAELWALQDEAQQAMRSWWDEHADDPTSDAARQALQTLREEHRAKMEALLEKYGVDLGDRRAGGCGGGRFGDGPRGGPMGGLMGLGPMGWPGGVPGEMHGHGGLGAGRAGTDGTTTTL